MLEEFRVSESRGVRRVNGSDPEAVAYRVNPSIHLQRTMRYCTLSGSHAGSVVVMINHNDN